MSGSYHPPGSFLGRETGRFSVRSCAVSSEEKERAQVFAHSTFLPALIGWMKSVEGLPQDSTIKREEQIFTCANSPRALNARSIGSIAKGKRRRKIA
ncbi:hypothetical protein H9L12_00945 [Sphingomonas rhizophila]|uniref:Uncharacterized protein n=1 Tax=Sphingomonas rhizophila TaxID=2071607 RepID=A0A7G9SBM4_9SPHN|nr:hypothetical protein [Sphingomonas rhizophila]QNN65249.1 hypothetical protein H9L12_00945 [Sphingomonas rhizophila]